MDLLNEVLFCANEKSLFGFSVSHLKTINGNPGRSNFVSSLRRNLRLMN